MKALTLILKKVPKSNITKEKLQMQSQACVASHYESTSRHVWCLITMGHILLNEPHRSGHHLLSFFLYFLNDCDHNT